MTEEYIGWLDDDWNTVLDQSQPVVRCRDCEHLQPRDEECGGRNWCKRMSFEVTPDGYCAWGERNVGE